MPETSPDIACVCILAGHGASVAQVQQRHRPDTMPPRLSGWDILGSKRARKKHGGLRRGVGLKRDGPSFRPSLQKVVVRGGGNSV